MKIFLLAICLLMIPTASAENIDALWNQLPTDALEQFDADATISFGEIARQLLSGELGMPGDWPDQIIAAAKETLRAHWLQMAGILSCACICEMARAFAGKKQACRALELLAQIAVAITLLTLFEPALQEVSAVCERLRSFTSLASPVLVAAMTLTGAPGMASAIPPSAAVADGLAVYLSAEIGLPLLRISAALALFGNLGGRFRLTRLFKLCIGAVKWMLGGCMTGFLALMGMRSILLGARDGATVQTVRFAVDNLLPIIGGELSDTVGSVFASAVLVKNAAGISVCIMLISMVLLPLVRLAVLALLMKVTSACLDLLGAPALPDMADRFAQVIEAMLAILAAVAALGMILAGAAVLTAGARG